MEDDNLVTYILDPANPPRLSVETLARLDAMTDEEIEANALADPDNPPLTDAELAHVRQTMELRDVRAGTGLTQAAFAERYGIPLERLREVELGHPRAHPVLLAYYRVIAREPEAVARALAA